MRQTSLKSTISAVLGISMIFSTPAFASNVAIVDSGTDFEHVLLKDHRLVNASEIAGNHIDDDKNGKVDDINGWNFIDNYGRIFFREHLADFNPIVYDLIRVIAHKQGGIATADEVKFWHDHVEALTKEEKTELSAHLNAFGEFAHSTHCSGIVVSQAPNAKIISARVFADDVPGEYEENQPMSFGDEPKKASGGWTKYVYKLMGAVSNGLFAGVGNYLNERHIDVANYSLGTPLSMIAKVLLGLRGIKNPTPEQVAAETKKAFVEYEGKARAWMLAAPNTLFVIAAGNDGSDNDVFPTFPSNVEVPNAIRVAASLDYKEIATFSNYGKTTVDVAAPGVSIDSTVPSLDREAILPMSGTSMAAPFVTGVAAHIKDINPKLSPVDVKAILMGTVDKKAWLEGKVIAAGVVNPKRAYAAAEASLTKDVAASIEASRSVADIVSSAKFKTAVQPQLVHKEAALFGSNLIF